MFYRTNDFRVNLLVYTALITSSVSEGFALIECDSAAKTLQVGLVSIASVGAFIALIEYGALIRLAASISRENVSFERLPVLYTAFGTVAHVCFYKRMHDKGLPLKGGDPLLSGYVTFCFVSIALLASYRYFQNDNSKRFA